MRLLRFRGLLALVLAACCLPVFAQEAPPAAEQPPPDWAKEDAAARSFALRVFHALRESGTTDGLIDQYFNPDTLSTYRKVAGGELGADTHSGCKLAPELVANVSDTMLRRKMVSEFDIEYLEPLYLFAAKRWDREVVPTDFDLRSVFPVKITRAEKRMEFFRFAPAANHCALEKLVTIGQLERSLDEAERAAALLRSALPATLWSKPEFQKQLKAVQGDDPLPIEHSVRSDGLYFHVPVNILFAMSVEKTNGRLWVDGFSAAAASDFVRRKPTAGMAEATKLAERFLASLHQELDFSKPMEEFMARDYVARLRSRRALPFFVQYTFDDDFYNEAGDEDMAQAVAESGNFLFLFFVHLAQAVNPNGSSDEEIKAALHSLPPELLEAGSRNNTVSFLFTQGATDGSDHIPNVKNREELHKFLKDLREINAVMRRTLPKDAFTSSTFRAIMAISARSSDRDGISSADLSPDFPDPVEMYTLQREFLTFEIVREDGEMRIWKVDLH